MESRSYQKTNRNDYDYDYNYAQSRKSYLDGNAAYDLSLFEGRPVNYEKTRTLPNKPAAKSKSRAGSAKSTARRSAPRSKAAAKSAEDRRIYARWVAVGILFVCAVAMLISSRMEYHELTQEVSAASERLEMLQHDYEGLRVTVDNKMSNSAIEKYAVETLGMQKREGSQTESISLGSGDFYEYSNGSNSRLKDILDQILS